MAVGGVFIFSNSYLIKRIMLKRGSFHKIENKTGDVRAVSEFRLFL